MSSPLFSPRALLCVVGLIGCGGKTNEAVDPSKAPTEAGTVDTYALLPGSMIGLGKLEVSALFRAGESGKRLGALLERYSPLGPESGFSIEHNVDRLICASYQLETADVLCVAVGRFDQATLDQAATKLEADAKAEYGDKVPTLVRTPYAGRTMLTAANVGLTLFDNQRLLLGTENAMRRALDRCRDGATPARAIPSDLTSRVLESQADLAASGNLEGTAFQVLSAGPVKIRLLQGLRGAYGEGTFTKRAAPPDGAETDASKSDVTFVTHLVYGDEERAASGREELTKLLGFVKMGSSLGLVPKVERTDVRAEGQETVVALGFRDEVLARWIDAAPERFGLPAPPRKGGVSGPVPGAD